MNERRVKPCGQIEHQSPFVFIFEVRKKKALELTLPTLKGIEI